MRLTLALLLVAGFFVACGGDDEYSEPSTSGGDPATQPSTSGGTEPVKPTEPAKPKAPPPSEAARTLAQLYKQATRRSGQDQIDFARKTAEQYDSSASPSDCFYYVGLLYRIAGEPEKAGDAFIRFTQDCPLSRNHKWGLYAGVDVLCKSDRIDKAKSFITEFEVRNPADGKELAKMRKIVGEAYLLQGDFANAVSALKKAGADAAGANLLQAYWAAGNYDEAATVGGEIGGEWEARANIVGRPASKLEVEGWAGLTDHSTDELAGKVHIVYFWGMPAWDLATKNDKQLKKLWDRYKDEDFQIVGVSRHDLFDPRKDPHKQESMTPDEEVDALGAWANSFKISWWLALVRNDANHDAYGFGGKYPYFAVVDKKGVLRFVYSGYSDMGYQLMAKVIEKCLDE